MSWSPESRAKAAERMRRLHATAWADPAVRAKMSAASKAAWADPAVRAKMSAARKAAWADDPRNISFLTDDEKKIYTKLRRCGVSRDDALAEIARAASPAKSEEAA
jgi:hypothetical protein